MTRTWMRKGAVVLALAALLAATAGCGWMGRTAGKAQAAVENGVEALNQGYKDGYEQKRAREKTGEPEKPAESQGSTAPAVSGNAI